MPLICLMGNRWENSGCTAAMMESRLGCLESMLANLDCTADYWASKLGYSESIEGYSGYIVANLESRLKRLIFIKVQKHRSYPEMMASIVGC